MPCDLCRIRGIEGIDAERNRAVDRGEISDTKQVIGTVFREILHRLSQHVDHLLFRLTDAAADGKPIEG